MALIMAIAMVMAEARVNGVEMDAVHEDGTIWLSSLLRERGPPGSGQQALLSLMDVAEEHGVPIRAAVVRDHDRLLEYYSRLGFEPVDHAIGPCGRTYTITIEYAP